MRGAGKDFGGRDRAKDSVCILCGYACTDGIGVYLIAGRYFMMLAGQSGHSDESMSDRARCADNLPNFWVKIMNREQRTEGAEFQRNVDRLLEKINRFVVCARQFHPDTANFQTDPVQKKDD